LSEAAYRAGKIPAPARSVINETLAASARFASNSSSVRDIIRAKYLADNGGLPPSPLTLLGSAQDILAYLSANPESARVFSKLGKNPLPPELISLTEKIENAAWYKDAVTPQPERKRSEPAPRIEYQSINGIFFRNIQPGTLKEGNRSFSIEGFSLMEAFVTPALWENFLAENPEWRKENKDRLIEQELVDNGYLETDDPALFPIMGVSWHAAKAFCAWLSAFLPDKTFEVRLPYEREWEYAAQNGYASIVHLPYIPAETSMPDLYIWCEDNFAPFHFLTADSQSIGAIGSPERSLRGGRLDKDGARGSLPPDVSSPFVSFRPVIAKKGVHYE
jgi:hypothetical protein